MYLNKPINSVVYLSKITSYKNDLEQLFHYLCLKDILMKSGRNLVSK